MGEEKEAIKYTLLESNALPAHLSDTMDYIYSFDCLPHCGTNMHENSYFIYSLSFLFILSTASRTAVPTRTRIYTLFIDLWEFLADLHTIFAYLKGPKPHTLNPKP